MFKTLALSPMRLTKNCGWTRDPVLKPDALPDNYAERYDAHTLIYSATYLAHARAIVLVCPKLKNLKILLSLGQFSSDQGSHKLHCIKHHRRHDEVWLQANKRPTRLTLTSHGLEITCTVAEPDASMKGEVVLQTVSKDNDLDWIHDWAAHYVRNQGVTHVLLFDNASTRYSAEDITETLRTVPGLSGATTVSVPLPFGPLGTKTPRAKALFLSVGLLNTSRHQFAGNARAVLSCDIDEVLISDSGRLLDEAERAFLGFATATVKPRFADLADAQTPTHGDHVHKRLPDKPVKEKWCLLPQGRLRTFVWDSHGVARYQFNWLSMRRGHRFYHCEHLSTHWGRRRGASHGETIVHDPRTAGDLARAGLR